MTLVETTDGKYIGSSQQSFIELQYGFSAELYEEYQARTKKVVLRRKRSLKGAGWWMRVSHIGKKSVIIKTLTAAVFRL